MNIRKMEVKQIFFVKSANLFLFYSTHFLCAYSLCEVPIDGIRELTGTVQDKCTLNKLMVRAGLEHGTFQYDTVPEATILPTEPRASSYLINNV